MGMMSIVIPAFWNTLEGNEREQPHADQPTEGVARRRTAACGAHQPMTPRSDKDAHGADEAQLLAHRREDEVGLLLGHVAQIRLRPVPDPRAEESTRADGVLRLLQVCRWRIAHTDWNSWRPGSRRWSGGRSGSGAAQAPVDRDESDQDGAHQQHHEDPDRRASPTASMTSSTITMIIAVPRSGCSQHEDDRDAGHDQQPEARRARPTPPGRGTRNKRPHRQDEARARRTRRVAIAAGRR